MKEAVLVSIARSPRRSSLYHFTRAGNLPAIAGMDALLSSRSIDPAWTGERRQAAKEVPLGGRGATINAHLRIPDRMLADGVTQAQFRACLDRHVFFWPTWSDCRHMLDTYTRREPQTSFAVLQFDTVSLLREHYEAAKLSKYDSGSAPRYAAACTYRKSPAMFLPLREFGRTVDRLVPRTPSEIREVLIEDRAEGLSRHLTAVYADTVALVPDQWRDRAQPLADLRAREK
ncbi:DUF7002 family protein [Paenibacillus cymbidii]|uniref:DUF7002 family protein n=1 Tax=Paenibacillus cymbidii TaxID=1639034 RepID=UPI00107FEDD3|nr:hypothetical protein [Paenibacillus cymbidii]